MLYCLVYEMNIIPLMIYCLYMFKVNRKVICVLVTRLVDKGISHREKVNISTDYVTIVVI